jgi:hypothetical protein
MSQGLVGVQSNQFPRALDIARPLRAAGLQVAIGGFHVSGCLAMLPEMQPSGAGCCGCSRLLRTDPSTSCAACSWA